MEGTDYHSPHEMLRAAHRFRTMLLGANSPIPRAKLGDLFTTWNKALNRSDPGVRGYLPKVQRGSKTDQEYAWAQATRLGLALARLRSLPAAEAEKEDRVEMLQLQAVRLGFPIQANWVEEGGLEEAREWFLEKAPMPLLKARDFEEVAVDKRALRSGPTPAHPYIGYGEDNDWFEGGEDVLEMIICVHQICDVTALSSEEKKKLQDLSSKKASDFTMVELGELLELKRKEAIPAASLVAPGKMKLIPLFQWPSEVVGEQALELEEEEEEEEECQGGNPLKPAEGEDALLKALKQLSPAKLREALGLEAEVKKKRKSSPARKPRPREENLGESEDEEGEGSDVEEIAMRMPEGSVEGEDSCVSWVNDETSS